MSTKVTSTRKSNRPYVNPEVYQFDLNVTRRLGRFLKPYRLRVALGVILMCTSVFDAIFGPALIGRAVDNGLARGNLALMSGLVIVYLAITAVIQTSTKSQTSTLARLGQTVIRDTTQ